MLNALFCVCKILFLSSLVTKGKGKGMVKEVFKGPEVCKDPMRICTHAAGVNIFKQGEDPLIKPKEEYPEWYDVVFDCVFLHCIYLYKLVTSME